MVGEGLLEEIARITAVREAGQLLLAADTVGEEALDRRLGVVRQLEEGLRADAHEDAHELLGRVVVEHDLLIEARTQAGVGIQERLHEVGVARHDDHEVVAVVLHGLEEGVDGLHAEVVRPGIGGQGIGLVDEEQAAVRTVHDLLGLDGRLADIAADEPGAVDLDQVPLAEHAELLIDLAEQTRHGGLAGTGVAGKDHVQRHMRLRQTALLTQLVDLQQVDETIQVLLDLGQTDETVQVREQVLDALLGLRLGLWLRLCLGQGRLEAGLGVGLGILIGLADGVGVGLGGGLHARLRVVLDGRREGIDALVAHLLPAPQVGGAVILEAQHQRGHALGLAVVILAVIGDELQAELVEELEQHQRGAAVGGLGLDVGIDEHRQQAQDGLIDGVGRDAVLLHEAHDIVPRQREPEAVVDDVDLTVTDVAVAVGDVEHEFHDGELCVVAHRHRAPLDDEPLLLILLAEHVDVLQCIVSRTAQGDQLLSVMDDAADEGRPCRSSPFIIPERAEKGKGFYNISRKKGKDTGSVPVSDGGL